MVKVSIIVPVYNVERYLSRCLDSILAQTLTDFEVICINDGSSDSCEKILKKYAQKDKRIKVYNQKNQGLSVARNKGLKKAKGKYIYFLDSDDFIHPQLLEICYDLAEKQTASLVSFSFDKVSDKQNPKEIHYSLNCIPHKITTTPLFYQTKRHKWKIWGNVWSKFYKRDLIQNLKFIIHITMEDYPYTYAVLSQNPKTVLTDIPLYHYRHNPASISNTCLTVKKIKDYHTGLQFVYKTYQQGSQKNWKFVLHHLFPNILKQQLNQINRSPSEKQKELLSAFRVELNDLHAKKCISIWGNGIVKWLTYKSLMKGKK